MDSSSTRIVEPAILFRIPVLWSPDLSAEQLYDATRGVWRVSKERARLARLAMAVFQGIIREVYVIQSWHPAGATPYLNRPDTEVKRAGRLEFRGVVADSAIYSKYVGEDVSGFFAKGAQNPIKYVNI